MQEKTKDRMTKVAALEKLSNMKKMVDNNAKRLNKLKVTRFHDIKIL